MAYAAIMAGGQGTRMGMTDIPKQFIMLENAPIIIHTIRAFEAVECIEKIVVMAPADWVDYTDHLVKRYLPGSAEKVFVTAGGETRAETLDKSVCFIFEHFTQDEDTVIITHDAVRPFVTKQMIEDNAKFAYQYGACSTTIPAVDTITISEDGLFIDKTPQRSTLFHSQTPQSFVLGEYKKAISNLDDEQIKELTDISMLFTLAGRRVYMVKGNVSNIKITCPEDMITAKAIYNNK